MRNILLVEDNEDDALFFRMSLKNADAKVIHVRCVEDAITQLESELLPDLIVLDLRLPGISIEGFLKWFREATPRVQDIPIVINTGALHVPQEIKSVARKTFFKSSDLVETRLNVLEMLGFAGPRARP